LALSSVTLPLQLAPDFFTLPGLLLPFTLPSLKFSSTGFLRWLIAAAPLPTVAMPLVIKSAASAGDAPGGAL